MSEKKSVTYYFEKPADVLRNVDVSEGKATLPEWMLYGVLLKWEEEYRGRVTWMWLFIALTLLVAVLVFMGGVP